MGKGLIYGFQGLLLGMVVLVIEIRTLRGEANVCAVGKKDELATMN